MYIHVESTDLLQANWKILLYITEVQYSFSTVHCSWTMPEDWKCFPGYPVQLLFLTSSICPFIMAVIKNAVLLNYRRICNVLNNFAHLLWEKELEYESIPNKCWLWGQLVWAANDCLKSVGILLRLKKKKKKGTHGAQALPMEILQSETVEHSLSRAQWPWAAGRAPVGPQGFRRADPVRRGQGRALQCCPSEGALPQQGAAPRARLDGALSIPV